MKAELQKLPLDTQSFDILRSEGYLYVDKTEYIHKMLEKFRIVFLSRPRRFGKSLLVSTLGALFEGKKDLFKGLYIYDKWDWTGANPVIRIDWTKIESTSPETIKTELVESLKRQARKYQITLISDRAVSCFDELIENLHIKFNKKVVVLIDEYDKSVTDNISNPKLEEFIRVTHDFYQVIKGADEHIRFVFLTGVSKFAELSVFSALNNPQNISLRPEFAAICGYSEEEIENNFSKHLDSVAERMKMSGDELLTQIKYQYDGFSWDGETFMHNPYSTLNFLDRAKFLNFWFNTGTPSMLLNIIKGHPKPKVLQDEYITDQNALEEGYLPSNPEEMLILFQSGYLTIKSVDERGRYILGYPNTEVKQAMSKFYNLTRCRV